MDTGEYHMMMLGETPAAGVYEKPAEVPVCHWTHYVHVDDVPACIEKAKSLGGMLMMGPQTIPEMVTFAVLTDPTGAVFGISAKPS